jgi:hypothetical protein
MRQTKAKAIRKYAVQLIAQREAEEGKPLQASYDMKVSGNATRYYQPYSVTINHVHRIRRAIVRRQRMAAMVGAPKSVNPFSARQRLANGK